MEKYFQKFREQVIGRNYPYTSPYGEQKIIYADWVASGRLYKSIEDKLTNKFGPFVANTHTETSETGTIMTMAYHHAKDIIRQHVNANSDDIVITTGFGMTGVVNKFQRLLNLKPCNSSDSSNLSENDTPVVFITHMEHHSNHTSWHETIADVVVTPADENGEVDLVELDKLVSKYSKRKQIIGSFTACSNVTGVGTPYHKMAAIMHKYNGLCFIDFAANAPYEDMNMHPDNSDEYLDAVMFSPHKFLGGPGSSGVLVFKKELYTNAVPDHPGGGTVDWTNAWGEYKYTDNIEAREDGGTPGFLQAIRTALTLNLKDEMGTKNIRKREEELFKIAFEELGKVNNLKILANNIKKRVGALSFYIIDLHYNLIVKLLNDRFGVQVRGGCACAGTYGHLLLNVTHQESKRITDMIDKGDLTKKPGWVRLSVHPTMTNDELYYICDAIKQIEQNHKEWVKDYIHEEETNEFIHKDFINKERYNIDSWFQL
ncbi:MAG: aminotransferase class V-fold PLP-dependent enzyme [Bacteroidales bacterium]|nr:aminotransferase class V-fold PLP-dependent enzyme [Bacteroidales bacterium]